MVKLIDLVGLLNWLLQTGDGEAAEAARATFEHARQREAQVVVDVSSVPKEASAADIASGADARFRTLLV
eukprot:SAG11_NODE_142_length_14906_cov_8.352333_16_plen_70_part_00